MSQQSQAQAQAQISALQQQNAMLNQHLHSQAQSHINHLQQLLPFHQPPHLAHPSPASFQSTPQPPAPQAPDPPTPAATPATQSGPSMSFNPDEILQQMKSTVESSIQAMVEKTQERQVHSIPTPPIPVEIPPRPASHPTSTPQHPPLQPQSSRRSRSHHHRSSPRRPDKRPVSAYRSPRRRRSSRHPRRSSRHRSNSRDASRHRRESSRRDRDSSITLKSASPHRRDHREQATDYYQPPDYSSNKPILQAAQWWTNQQSTDYTTSKDNSYYPEQSSKDKWQSWGRWKDYSKYPSSSHQSTEAGYKKSSHHHNQPHESTTKPLTAFSSTQQAPPPHKKKKPVLSGDDQSQVSVNVLSGHTLINLREGSKEEWIRGVKFGLRRPDRMPAASEVPYELQPKPTKTVEIEEFNRAVATLKQVDSKIPNEIAKKAINLLFSTNLLPGFDLEKPFIIELPSTNMLALIIPLPETSHFQMPPPFKNHQNHTWALLHGTTIETSQAILLEGKIRPANWSFNKDYIRCDMPTFGAFYLDREISKSDTFPEWAAKELMDIIQKKGKGQQDVIVGAMYRGACQHTAFKAGGNEMAQLSVAEKGIATTSEKYTIAHSNHVGLKFIALKWQNPPQTVDDDKESSSDDSTYRGINARTKDRRSGRWDDNKP